IKQGSKTGKEHVQSFKQCYMQSGYGETVGIHEFKRSLNSPLLNKIMVVPELPTTLEKWYDLAWLLRKRSSLPEAEKETQGSKSNQLTQPSRQPAQPPTLPAGNQGQFRDPNAMDVDHNRSPHCCYNCGQTGHFAHNC
ncbi:hypothetical protein AMATHDRAFT_125380, partial [Amanita thiersii Skay4041]